MAPRRVSLSYGSLDKSTVPSKAKYTSQGQPDVLLQEPAVVGKRGGLMGISGRWVKLGITVGLAVGAIAAVVHLGYSTVDIPAQTSRGSFVEAGIAAVAEQKERPELSGSSNSNTLSFTALNYYHSRDGEPGQDYPWLQGIKLIEPHRATTLAVTNSRKGFGYRWEIRGDGHASEIHATATGAEAIVILKRLDENLVVLEEVNASGEVTRRLEEIVMVKYVRREIRTLTDDEREELLDAMFKLWAVRVQDGNGREIYGDDYSDIWAINRLHYKAASPRVCDHFHDGLGFLTNHGLLSNTFEYSLQQVNPKLTLPYWDFTIESSSTGAAENEQLKNVFDSHTKTPLLQPSWFGTRDSDDNMVKDGRWAYTEIPKMKQNNPSGIEPDVYSKLRAPWNVNDRAYLTRGMGKMCHMRVEDAYPWPTCEMHYDLATQYDDFYSWVWASLYDPHGPVHIWIGGVLDCEVTYQKIAALVGEEVAAELAMLSFVHRKNMFRDGFFACEGTADVSESPEEIISSGLCGCQGYDLTQGDDYLQIFKTMSFMEEYMIDSDEDSKRKLVEILCHSTVNDGDHLQASSSLDPSFWPTHPTMERLWMYSVLTGQVTDFHWPDSDVTFTASDGTTYTESISIYSEECKGHRGSDVFPFDLLSGDSNDFTVQTGIKGNAEGGGNVLTNKQALAAFDPRVNGLSYIYDTFKWPHCEADGVNMSDAWMKASDSSSGLTKKEGSSGGEEGSVDHPGAVKPLAGFSPQDRTTVGGRTVFEKGTPRYPQYASLTKKMASLKERKAQA